MNESTNWRPIWSLELVILVFIATTCFFIVPSTYFSTKILFSFEDPSVRKKWVYYMAGYFGLIFSFYTLLLFNYFTDPTFRTIISFINLIMLPSGFLMYLGIGRQLDD